MNSNNSIPYHDLKHNRLLQGFFVREPSEFFLVPKSFFEKCVHDAYNLGRANAGIDKNKDFFSGMFAGWFAVRVEALECFKRINNDVGDE